MLDPIATFESNFRQIEDLLEFDQLILQIPIALLERVVEAQDRAKIARASPARADKALKLLTTIRANESIRPRFQTVYNQSLVLAVSYFASAVRELFIVRLSQTLQGEDGAPKSLLEESLTISVRDAWDLRTDSATRLAETIIHKKEISFQDMQSIARAFRTYIGLSVERDAEVNDIITAHACRHALVHAGGMVDRKLLAQVRDAMPRRIQPVLQEGASIQLSPAELRTVGTSMTGYLNRLTG